MGSSRENTPFSLCRPRSERLLSAFSCSNRVRYPGLPDCGVSMSLANIVMWNRSTETAVLGSHNRSALWGAADGSIATPCPAGHRPISE